MQEEEDCQPQLPRHSLVCDGGRTQDLPEMRAVCRVRVTPDWAAPRLNLIINLWIIERQMGDT